MQQATIAGNIGDVKEITKALSVRVAVRVREKIGAEWRDRTDWWTVLFFGDRWLKSSSWFQRGRFVTCTGSFLPGIWESRDKGPQLDLKLFATECTFGPPKQGDEQRGQSEYRREASRSGGDTARGRKLDKEDGPRDPRENADMDR